MIGSFIGTFAVGLLGAHVYHNGRAIKKKLDKAYDDMCSFFWRIHGTFEEDEERMKLAPEEEAEAIEWCRRNPKKKGNL